MNFQNNRKLFFILLGISLLLLGTIVFIAYSLFTRSGSSNLNESPLPSPTVVPYSGTVEIEKVTPGESERDADQLSGIIVYFKNTPPPLITITLSPSIEGTYKRDDQAKTIAFLPTTAFQSATRYTATLKAQGDSIVAPSGRIGISYSWSFTIGGQQGEAGFTQNEQQQFSNELKKAAELYQDRKARLPFIIHMPYETTHFTISISAVNDDVTITTHGENQSEIDTYKTEALNWLRSNGGNPDTLTINYLNTPN